MTGIADYSSRAPTDRREGASSPPRHDGAGGGAGGARTGGQAVQSRRLTSGGQMGMPQLLCPVLVGRDDEVAAITGALDRAAAGHGGAVFVVGEAGLGKSRLVGEAEAVARAMGLTVLDGRAVAGERASACLLYTSPSPRDGLLSRMPSSA